MARPVDFDILRRVAHRVNTLSASEIEDARFTLIASRWLHETFGEFRGYYPTAPRGEVTRKGSNDALFTGAIAGIIDAH